MLPEDVRREEELAPPLAVQLLWGERNPRLVLIIMRPLELAQLVPQLLYLESLFPESRLELRDV